MRRRTLIAALLAPLASGLGRGPTGGLAGGLGGALAAAQAVAAEAAVDPRLLAAAAETSLAYMVTGDAAVDETSRRGLAGLSQALAQRTTVEPGEPVAIDPDRDDLAVLTLIYWPVTDTQPLPSPQGYVRLNRFLRTGGVILFDTRDGDLAGSGAAGSQPALQRLAAALDVPPLAPVPADHVLTRAFYLIDDFPGRWDGTELWAEAGPAAASGAASGSAAASGAGGFRPSNDGVSPVIIGANAFAEAWAIDEAGQPVFAVGRGIEGERQREMALRFGVNLVMYVLTGNYKSDQVHVPELLERLGREAGGPRGDLTEAVR